VRPRCDCQPQGSSRERLLILLRVVARVPLKLGRTHCIPATCGRLAEKKVCAVSTSDFVAEAAHSLPKIAA
jgi:hypothetical protein